MKIVLSTALFLVLLLTHWSEGANILFFFGVSTYSHRIVAWPLVEALVERGHKVAFVQAAKNKNPNPKVEDIVLTPAASFDPFDFLQLKLKFGSMMSPMLVHVLPELGIMTCNETLNDKKFMDWATTNKPDLVVIDALFNDCALGFAHKWGAQTIVFGTSSQFEWWPDEFGFPSETNWIPNLHFGHNMPLSFLSRVCQTLVQLYVRFLKYTVMYPKLEALLRKEFHPNMPPLSDLGSNSSLILMNTHFSEELGRSLPPMVVPIGGIHCVDANKLPPIPKDIEKFINESGPSGFIYVSFGGEVKLANAPEELRSAFFNAFRKTKTRFIWKWEGERPVDMPPNVLTVSWVPQQSILAHPKIRAFITHGGLLSMQEALYHSVPMISFAIFAEQDYNAERLHRTKRGIRLEITTVTEDELSQAIQNILTDETYKRNVQRTGKLFKDRPMKPVDTAVWWTEYVIRNREDAHTMKPMAVHQWWFQKRNLDVWVFILGVLFSLLASMIFTVVKLIKWCCCGSSSKRVKDKTKVKVKKH